MTRILAVVAAGWLVALPISASAQNSRGARERSRQTPPSDARGGESADPGGGRGGRRAGPPPGARPNEDNRVVGNAVPRPPLPPPRGNTIVVPGYYPPGYGSRGYYGFGFGLGLGYGGFGYDPWSYGYYDPLYGYPRPYVAAPWGRGDIDGAIRLKVSPSDATVYVDGFYAGRVDDYDGMFQRLHLEPGPHRIEIQMDGYESLSFDVRIAPDRTINYEGELRTR